MDGCSCCGGRGRKRSRCSAPWGRIVPAPRLGGSLPGIRHGRWRDSTPASVNGWGGGGPAAESRSLLVTCTARSGDSADTASRVALRPVSAAALLAQTAAAARSGSPASAVRAAAALLPASHAGLLAHGGSAPNTPGTDSYSLARSAPHTGTTPCLAACAASAAPSRGSVPAPLRW